MKKFFILYLCVYLFCHFGSAIKADVFGTGDNIFEIDFVTISGNSNPVSGYGVVENDFRIGTYEITNDQWDKFIAINGPLSGSPLYAYERSSYFTGSHIPTDNVSWFEAARFVNWLNISKGKQVAYKFENGSFVNWSVGDEGYDSSNPYRNSNAYYFLPSEDEWVKAAYWNGSELQTFATKAGESLHLGDGVSGTGWNYWDNGYITDPASPWAVGSGSEELNGTYDMMGNVYEWLESPYEPVFEPSSFRIFRAGVYGGHALTLSSSHRGVNYYPGYEGQSIGFRVAAVPEPCSFVLLFLGGLTLRIRKN